MGGFWSQGNAADLRSQFREPKGQPAPFEASVARHQDFPIMVSVGKNSHYHTLQGGFDFQSSSSWVLSRKVSMANQKPRWQYEVNWPFAAIL